MFCFRHLILALFSTSIMLSCTVYDVDTADSTTLAGSLSRAINKDRGRSVAKKNNYDDAPTYVDYSKNNPLLRHDDEYTEDETYEAVDPFEEEVDFAEYKKLKERQQQKRQMEENHNLGDDKNGAMSLW